MRPRNTPTNKEIFLEHIKKSPNGCWDWEGYYTDGYGTIRYQGKSWLAHRLSYKFFVGDLRELQVLHKCDNRKCVNPDHLYLGTNSDNVRDRVSRNREAYRKGEANPRARLSENDVRLIRNAVGLTNQAIANEFGVSYQLISRIRRKECWTHLNDPES